MVKRLPASTEALAIKVFGSLHQGVERRWTGKHEVRTWMALGEILEAGERCGACGWHAPYCTTTERANRAPRIPLGIGNGSIPRRHGERGNDEWCLQLKSSRKVTQANIVTENYIKQEMYFSGN